MTMKSVSKVVIPFIPVLTLAYDAVAYAVGGNDATISRVLLTWAAEYAPLPLALAFGFGVLFGHLFVPQHADT